MHLHKKRILHFIDSEGVYGAERVILNLSQQLKCSTDYTPVVGCIVSSPASSNPLYDAAIALGLEAVKIPIANSKVLTDLPKAAAQLQSLNIDLIHSHGYKPSVYGFIIRLLKHIPVIATCHLWFEPSKGPLKMRTMIRLEKIFHRWFPKVIAVSEPIREILLANGLKPNRVDVVQNGVDIPEQIYAEADISLLRQTLNIPDNTFCILNSARLTRQKAQWVLVEAAALLKQQGYKVQFLIVGEGSLGDELKQLIQQRQVSDCVNLLGFRSDVNKLLALADVFALPSIDEGMPMSLLEAAAASKPIISTLVGDIGKLIIHNETGMVIPLENPEALAEAIIHLKNTPSFALQLAKQAHEKMRTNYSSEAMSQRYQEIYQYVISTAK